MQQDNLSGARFTNWSDSILQQFDGINSVELLQLGMTIIAKAMRPDYEDVVPYRNRLHYEDQDANDHMNLIHQRKQAIHDLLSDLSIPDTKYILNQINWTINNKIIIPE